MMDPLSRRGFLAAASLGALGAAIAPREAGARALRVFSAGFRAENVRINGAALSLPSTIA